MEITPEQINLLINGGLIIISVIVGGIITILGGIIANTFQKKQQEIKSRKEIFDVRFSQVENYLSEILIACRNLSNALLQNQSQERIIIELNKILDVSTSSFILAGLRGTRDNQIFEAMQGFLEVFNGFIQNINFYLMAHMTQSKDVLQEIVLSIASMLEERNVLLKERMDDFKLNDYKPKYKMDINDDRK